MNGHVKNPVLLLRFIGRSSNLKYLKFSYCDLGQSFYDQVTEIVQSNGISLQRLSLKKSSVELNFKFVTRLPDLETFEVDQELAGELIAELFESLPYLSEIEVSEAAYTLMIAIKTIQRSPTGKYRLNGKVLGLPELLDNLQATNRTASNCNLM